MDFVKLHCKPDEAFCTQWFCLELVITYELKMVSDYLHQKY